MRQTLITIILIFLLHGSHIIIAGGRGEVNETLLEATSPVEDLIEYAISENDEGISKSVATVESYASALHDVLSVTAGAEFNGLLEKIRSSAKSGDHQAIAVGALRVYRLLIDNLQDSKLQVPKEVNLLDYAGFKLHVLAAAPQPDWNAIRSTVNETAGWWLVVKAKVSENGLKDAFNSTIRGLKEAGQSEQLPMLIFAAQIDLDLVDLLEGFFEQHK